MNLLEKIKHSRELIKNAYANHKVVKIACSLGKDSLVILDFPVERLAT